MASRFIHESQKVNYGRSLFLEALRMGAPWVIDDLFTVVRPFFRSIPGEVRLSTSSGFYVSRIENFATAFFFDAEPQYGRVPVPDLRIWSTVDSHNNATVQRFKQDVLEWASKYNLNVSWMLDIALKTLFYWEKLPDTLPAGPKKQCPHVRRHGQGLTTGDLMWCPNVHYFVPFVDEELGAFDFHHEGWVPELGQTWAEFEKEITKTFSEALQDYHARMQELLKHRNFSDPGIRNVEHFDWLAEYHVVGKSPGQIKRRYGLTISENAIQKAVNDKAKLIGLPIRPPKRDNKAARKDNVI